MLQLFIPMFWKVSSWFPIVSSSSSFKLFGITFSEIQRDKNKMWFTYLSFLGIGVGGEEIEFCIDSMWLQGSTIGIRGVRMYTYFYWHTHDFGCWMFTLTYTLIFSLMIFLSFQKFFESSFLLWFFKTLLLFICSSTEVFPIDITLVDVHLNWLNWYHVLILIVWSTSHSNRLHDFSATIPSLWGCVCKNFMPDPGVVCLQNAFLWPVI